MNLKKTIFALAIIILGSITINQTIVKANPSVFSVIPPLSVKQTVPPYFSYLKSGNSTTTTVSLDSYVAGTNDSVDQGSASLLLNLIATSTPPTLKWRFEFSQDGTTWYPESIQLTTNATTTVVVRDFAEYSWAFASSTAGSATASSSQKLVSVPTPTRYVRTVFYLPPGSANAALFYRYIVKSQI